MSHLPNKNLQLMESFFFKKSQIEEKRIFVFHHRNNEFKTALLMNDGPS